MTNDLTRPIIGIENRTAQEVFDIMCDRFRRAPLPSPAPGVVEALRGAHDAFDTIAECAENCIHSPGQMTNYSTAKYGMALVSTALASLSQPAKGAEGDE
ncbi:MAG: hypothetical protein WA975_18025 [Mesorhizobium sp.]